jgi:hypothetical protein
VKAPHVGAEEEKSTMYVDPSRVALALRYAELATRSAAEREPATDDLRVFLAALWADATSAGRTRYSAALARAPGSIPWSAMQVPASPASALPGVPVLRGPAAVELLLGQEDPDDEGVPAYRLRAGNAEAEAVLAALYSWDTEALEMSAAPQGWRLGADEGDISEVSRSPQGAREPGTPEPETPEQETPEQSPSGQREGRGAERAEPTGAAWKLGAVAAGFLALGFAAWKWG